MTAPDVSTMPPRPLDSQAVEIMGRNLLMAELLRAGIEVALPLRDRGIDLIAYADTGSDVAAFSAVPIQMKASSGRGFGIDGKYAKFPNLLIAHIWGVRQEGRGPIFAMTQAEAVAIGDAMGWTKTSSWTDHHGYSTRSPSKQLCALLEPYRMDSDRWRKRVIGQMNRCR